jgi:hypothetical protein
LTKNASQGSINQQIFPLIPERFLSELPEPPLSREPLSPADLERVKTGETKAENTIAWGRNALKERGLISLSSSRGTWELTTKGLKEGLEIKHPRTGLTR